MSLRQIYTMFSIFLFALPAYAKTNITVAPFVDKSVKSRCPGLTAKAKIDLDQALRARLIDGLMELRRFSVQEREVSKFKPEHTIVGTLRTFEVCALEGRGEKVQIVLEVHMLSAKGGLTHVFSSTAQTSSTASNRAPAMAVNAAISEIIKRVDDAVPRRAGPIRLTGKRGDSNSMIVKLLPRERR